MIPADAWALIQRIANEGTGWEADACRTFLEQDASDALVLANTPSMAGHGNELRGDRAGAVVAGVIRR
jgi:hypothetical protein